VTILDRLLDFKFSSIILIRFGSARLVYNDKLPSG